MIKYAVILLNKTDSIAKDYLTQNTLLTEITNVLAANMINEIPAYFSSLNFPNFKIYSSIDTSNIAEQIRTNAVNNILRSCVVSADRIVSKLSANDLTDYITQQRLDEIIDVYRDNDTELSKQLCEVAHLFPDSDRTRQQNLMAQVLVDIRDIAVLAGPAGCGKTRIALEWARIKQAKKIIWICPRVQICQGMFTELTEHYLPDAQIEILTGEFKYTNNWHNPTRPESYFSADVVVTTIDQIISSITSHTKVDALLDFMSAHVIFDEYHEYINMDILNLLFAELVAAKNMRSNWHKDILLVSATPHYLYLQDLLKIDLEDVVTMASFNQSQYQIQFVEYDENILSSNPFFQSYPDNTFVISNTAITAQQGFILNQQTENSLLFHAKFKRSDKKDLFNQLYASFGEQGTGHYQILRSGPIVQASLNITCDRMLTEMSSAENLVQRLGRLDRFGKNQAINIFTIAITEPIKKAKPSGSSAYFLDALYSLKASKAWYDFLQANLADKSFQLSELYQLYRQFYTESTSRVYLQQDLSKALTKSISKLNEKVTEPIKVYVKTENKTVRISRHSLRGDNRFVQSALLNVESYQQPHFINQYAYQMPLNECDTFDNLTESLDYIRKNTNIINFMAGNQHHIDSSHPINQQGIPKENREKAITNYARNPEYPLYLSYIEEDLNRIGGTSQRSEDAIYYAVCDKQPIGLISYEKILLLNLKNNL